MTLFVLDTDHLSLYQRNAEPLLSKLLSHPADELAIRIVTVEEQCEGGWPKSEKRRLPRT